VSHRFVDIGGVRLHVAKAVPRARPRAPATPCSCCAAFRSIGMPGGGVIGLLTPQYRLICVDLRGFG